MSLAALDWAGVVAPLAVIAAALLVIVVALVAGRSRKVAAPATGPNGDWRADHGPAVDVWLEEYRVRFAGLADALAGRTPMEVPDPVHRQVEERMDQAIAASPDPVLAEGLRLMQEAGQAALVATVAGRMSSAASAYEVYLAARAEALSRLGALTADKGVSRSGRTTRGLGRSDSTQ